MTRSLVLVYSLKSDSPGTVGCYNFTHFRFRPLSPLSAERVSLPIVENQILNVSEPASRVKSNPSRFLCLFGRSGNEVILVIDVSGLSHDGARCQSKCMNCSYWRVMWPDEAERIERLSAARQRILDFRQSHGEGIRLNDILRSSLIAHLNEVYRDCQVFAEDSIRRRTEDTLAILEKKPDC